MKDKVYYYNRNGILQLTLNEYPYWTEPRDLFNWSWGFNEQFGHINTFRRAKETYELTIVIDGDYPARHNDLCDIFNADVLANEPGYLLINGWKLPCYITEAENDVVFDTNRQSTFAVRAINSTWIRENTETYNGDPSGGSTGEDLGRDYIYWVEPSEEHEDTGSIVEIDNPDSNLEVTSLSVEFAPIQSGSGTPSPSNVRPISGRTECDTYVSPTTSETDAEVYTTTLGRTVYGGTLDVVSGELTVTHASVDMGDLAWYPNGSITGGAQYAVSIADKAVGETNFICSAYEAHRPSADIGYICGRATTNVVACNSTITSFSAFKTAVAGQTICYELATPQTYQLTETQINLITGHNYVWSSVSDIDIKYQTRSVAVPARGYNYGYSTPESHYASIDLAGSGNGFEAVIYGPQVNPTIYLNNQPVKVNVTLDATQRLRIVSNGSVKTIEILEPNGASTDAFVYRDKENTPFLTLGQHTDLTFGQIRFDFTTIERRSQPTWN